MKIENLGTVNHKLDQPTLHTDDESNEWRIKQSDKIKNNCDKTINITNDVQLHCSSLQGDYQEYEYFPENGQRNGPISVDVGGTVYRTSIQTLTTFPMSRLGRMFNGTLPLPFNKEEKTYFLDSDGAIFRHILNFCRYKVLSLPSGFRDLDLLHTESKFYDIPSLTAAIEQKMQLSQSANAAYEHIN